MKSITTILNTGLAAMSDEELEDLVAAIRDEQNGRRQNLVKEAERKAKELLEYCKTNNIQMTVWVKDNDYCDAEVDVTDFSFYG